MKKLIAMLAALSLSAAGTAGVFADAEEGKTDDLIYDDNGEVIGRDPAFPPVEVDVIFGTDIQDFLTDETVKNVKIIDVKSGDSGLTETELTFQSGTLYLDEQQRVRIPIREFATQIGFNVTWYPETGQAAVYDDYEWYVFTPGNDVVICSPIMKNVGHMYMDCTPVVIDGVMYLPLRHLSDIFYRHIVWDESAATARLYPSSVISVGKGTVYIGEDDVTTGEEYIYKE